MAGVPTRVVIDTNVCLDLFIYRDAFAAPLMQALRQGEVVAATREDCRQEWLRVLHYPRFDIDAAQYAECCAAYDVWLQPLPALSARPANTPDDLPRCSDPDDQKFLELALEVGAGILITKDKALLKLHRRTYKRGWFAILTPQAWSDWNRRDRTDVS